MYDQVLPSPVCRDYHPRLSAKVEIRSPLPGNLGQTDCRELTAAEVRCVYRRLHDIRFNNERYRKYRDGPDGKKGIRQEDVWPSDVEEVFWEAIATYRPLAGRKKRKAYLDDPKIYGRNEIIAMYMKARLGAAFSHLQYNNKNPSKPKTPRKVVSSHIQVLKHKFRDPQGIHSANIEVMFWLGGDNKKDKADERRSARGREMLRSHQLAAPGRINLMQPAAFHMYVGSAQSKLAYTFTSSKGEPYQLGDIGLSLCELENRFPILGYMWQQHRLSCSVLLAESSIAWVKERPRTESAHSQMVTNLTIVNTFETVPRAASVPRNCSANVRYFHEGRRLDYPGLHEIDSEVLDDGRCVFEVKMGSRFWANQFQRWWKKIQETKMRAERNEVPMTAVSREDDECRRCIENITAVIEIYGDNTKGEIKEDEEQDDSDAENARIKDAPKASKPLPELLMVVHWSFKASPAGTPGKTTWRNLSLPQDGLTNTSEHSIGVGAAEYLASSSTIVRPTASLSGDAPYMSIFSRDDAVAGPTGSMLYEPEQAATAERDVPWYIDDAASEDSIENHFNFGQDDASFDVGGTQAFDFGLPLDPAIATDSNVPVLDPAIMAGVAESLGQGQALNSSLVPYAHLDGLCVPSQPESQLQEQLPHAYWAHPDQSRPAHDIPESYYDRGQEVEGRSGNPHQQAGFYAPCVPSMRSTQQGLQICTALSQHPDDADYSQTQSQGSSGSRVLTPLSSCGTSLGNGGATGTEDEQVYEQSSANTSYSIEHHPMDALPPVVTQQESTAQQTAGTFGNGAHVRNDVHGAYDQQHLLFHGGKPYGMHGYLEQRHAQSPYGPQLNYITRNQAEPQSQQYSPYYAGPEMSQTVTGTRERVDTPQSCTESTSGLGQDNNDGPQHIDQRPDAYPHYDLRGYTGLDDIRQYYSQTPGYIVYQQSQSQQHDQTPSRASQDEEEWVHVQDGSSTPRGQDADMGLVFDLGTLEDAEGLAMQHGHDQQRRDGEHSGHNSVPRLLPSALEA